MNKLILLFIALMHVPAAIYASTITFNGTVIDENGQPISHAVVNINQVDTQTNAHGKFTAHFPKSEYYQVHISKQNFYDRLHSYSHTELEHAALNHSGLEPFELMTRKDNRVMLAFAGDVMMGRRYYKPYFDDAVLINATSVLEDSKQLVQHVKPYLSIADLAAVNLESQLAEQKPTTRAKKSVTFYSAPETVAALKWAGVDYVTLGNNHTYDYLDEGLEATLQALDEYQLPYSGAGHTEEEALKAYQIELANRQLALLGYVGWQGSSAIKQTAGEKQGGAAFGSKHNIVQAVEKAAKQGQLPIVQYHGSLEYKKEPTGVTEDRLKAAIDAGAALAIGHHPHVTQGLELYNDKLIAYSMGNFIFDQNFSSTQHSFILYVWLDNGVFKKAEIVPIYLKGYKPTPAMDNERVAVLKRMKVLSAKRNTRIQDHNGHGVIQPQNNKSLAVLPASANSRYKVFFDNKTNTALPFSRWSEEIKQIILPNNRIKYRLGTNLINGSSFEQFNWFTSPERGFLLPDNWSLITPGYKSQTGLKLTTAKKSAVWLGMKHFRRVYSASNAVTLSTKINVEKPIKINVYWQGRKTRQKLFDAFETSPKNLIKSIELSPNDSEWQSIEVDFNSPRIGYRSYRVLVEIVNESLENKTLMLDDFSLIEWQTPYQNQIEPLRVREDAQMATHIGVNKPLEMPITVVSSE